MHRNRTVLVQDNVVTIDRLDDTEIVEMHDSVVLRFNNRLFEQLSCRSTDVESPHRQLRSGFADALSGDNTHRLTKLDHASGRKVTAVALSTDTALGFAGKHRTDLQLLHANLHQSLSLSFFDQLVRFDDRLLGDRVDNRFAAYASNDPGGQVNDFVITLVNRTDKNAVGSSTIRFDNDNVLRGIDQFTGQVAGVRSLQRGVCQPLTCTVSRDKVLHHRQPFAEVGGNRVLNDFARRLGHQTTHTAQLFDLLARTARPGILHEKYRVQFFAPVVVLQRAEHQVRNFFTRMGPDIDDLIVAFAVGDDAAAILFLDQRDLFVSLLELCLL